MVGSVPSQNGSLPERPQRQSAIWSGVVDLAIVAFGETYRAGDDMGPDWRPSRFIRQTTPFITSIYKNVATVIR